MPGMGMGMPGMGGMRVQDPEMFDLNNRDRDLERQTRELAEHCRHASGDERAKFREQLEDLVDKHFEVRQQRRLLELKRLESQLQRLREAIDRRAKARKKLVEKRMTDLIGPEEGMEF